jgi:hypothetical protein
MNDFAKFNAFVKGVIATGYVVKYGEKFLRNEAKMHFNRVFIACEAMEKFIHRNVDPEVAEAEDVINSAIVGMICQLYDLPPTEMDRFIQHINDFETLEK